MEISLPELDFGGIELGGGIDVGLDVSLPDISLDTGGAIALDTAPDIANGVEVGDFLEAGTPINTSEVSPFHQAAINEIGTRVLGELVMVETLPAPDPISQAMGIVEPYLVQEIDAIGAKVFGEATIPMIAPTSSEILPTFEPEATALPSIFSPVPQEIIVETDPEMNGFAWSTEELIANDEADIDAWMKPAAPVLESQASVWDNTSPTYKESQVPDVSSAGQPAFNELIAKRGMSIEDTSLIVSQGVQQGEVYTDTTRFVETSTGLIHVENERAFARGGATTTETASTHSLQEFMETRDINTNKKPPILEVSWGLHSPEYAVKWHESNGSAYFPEDVEISLRSEFTGQWQTDAAPRNPISVHHHDKDVRDDSHVAHGVASGLDNVMPKALQPRIKHTNMYPDRKQPPANVAALRLEREQAAAAAKALQ